MRVTLAEELGGSRASKRKTREASRLTLDAP